MTKIMKKEDKELLIKDLCARLPYGIVTRIETPYSTFDMCGQFDMSNVQSEFENVTLNIDNFSTIINNLETIECIKPYLRPLSSMTEEELEELNCLCYHNISIQDNRICGYICGGELEDVIDWLNKKHFDYRGLIPKKLALEAFEDMYV